MSRPVTLFTGQWADLPLETLAQKVSEWGFDGLELACWGDHFEVDKALESDSYVQSRWDILNKYNLKCFAISTHLVGQCVCDDPIDERHKSILPGRIWGDGNPEGVRRRASEEVKNTARAEPNHAALSPIRICNASRIAAPPMRRTNSGAIRPGPKDGGPAIAQASARPGGVKTASLITVWPASSAALRPT